MPTSASRSLYLIETYWADSTGRRNASKMEAGDGYQEAPLGDAFSGAFREE